MLLRRFSGTCREKVSVMLVVVAPFGAVKGGQTERGHHASVWFVCSRGSHLDIWRLFSSRPCIWLPLVLCLVLPCGVRKFVLLGDDFTESSWVRRCTFGYSCALPGSTVDTRSAPVRGALGRIAHIFYVDVLRCFFFVLTQNGEVCSVHTSGALKSGILCTSCTWLAGFMMEGRGGGSVHRHRPWSQ